ncbi:MAG TPA: glycosyltransferase [Pyrinomonadaceae bacterium]|nr:glycosyltransferase [Pyrinomonadaceae bacterium]
MSASKKIVITTFGSLGDIHPYMAIARELQARGHDPLIATMSLYREKIEAAGLRFASVRPDVPPPQQQNQELIENIMEPKSGPRFLMEEVIFPALRDSYEDLLRIVNGQDLLLTHPATYAGPLLAYKIGIPWISTVLAPTSFMSAYDPPVPPFWPWLVQLKGLGPRFMKLVIAVAKRSYRPEAIDRFRAELGIQDYGNAVFEGQHSPKRVLALFSSVFAAAQPDWPRQTCITGFAFDDGGDESEIPPKLLRFLDAGPPPIVFTLGSSAVWVARDFFQQSVAATKALGRRAVLLIGDERNLPSEALPPDIIAVDYAPYQALLPRACLMVHHGGVGTTSEGLRAGIPTLIVPFAFDQSDNAARAARLGTSRTVYRSQYSATRATKELGILLDRPHYAETAKAISNCLRHENGTTVACDLIEKLLLDDRGRQQEGRELAYASGC